MIGAAQQASQRPGRAARGGRKIIEGLQEAVEAVRSDSVEERPALSPVSKAAAEALAKADGDVKAATAAMLAKVRKSRPLREALTEPLLEQACYAAITKQCRRQRNIVWTAPNYTAGGNGQRVIALATSLLDFPLPGGRRLGEATREEVMAGAQFYRGHADDMAHKARWLARIAAELKPEQRVADGLDETRLAALQKEEMGDA